VTLGGSPRLGRGVDGLVVEAEALRDRPEKALPAASVELDVGGCHQRRLTALGAGVGMGEEALDLLEQLGFVGRREMRGDRTTP
jgi:hypothetical protein